MLMDLYTVLLPPDPWRNTPQNAIGHSIPHVFECMIMNKHMQIADQKLWLEPAVLMRAVIVELKPIFFDGCWRIAGYELKSTWRVRACDGVWFQIITGYATIYVCRQVRMQKH